MLLIKHLNENNVDTHKLSTIIIKQSFQQAESSYNKSYSIFHHPQKAFTTVVSLSTTHF